jgi:poly-gamma-glutamate capsule biosynthesis protein CapA/YwtB (metallophosphatase superfamily)
VTSNNVTVGFTGDVMIGRGVNKIISLKGYTYPWGNVLPMLRTTDMNIINLETTLTNSNRKVEKTFNFKASPDKIKTLEEAHITVANLANNHILDFSEEGLIETIKTLDDAGIKHVGAGLNDTQATKPEIVVVQNIRFGIIGFTDNESTWKATAKQPGTNYINIARNKDQEYAFSLIEQLRKNVDVLIVTIHWGYNLVEEPSDLFISFAHEMIDHGADLIHGHSAHIFQALEIYKRKLILYDTGDFIDDYIVHEDVKNDHSFFFLAEFSQHGIEALKLIPVLIDHYQVNLATNDDYKWCIERMQFLSRKFGTHITNNGNVMLSQVKE